MKAVAMMIVLVSVLATTGCQKAQPHAQVICPPGKDLPTHSVRYPMRGDNKGPYPVLVAPMPHPMDTDDFLKWLNAHKDTHFVVALPPKEVERVSEDQIQQLLIHLGCRYTMDLSHVEYATHTF